MILKNKTFQRIIGGSFFERLGINTVSRLHFIEMSTHKDKMLVKCLRKIRRERVSLVTGKEMFMIYSLAKSCSTYSGDFAEVGVFEGSTARLICEAKGNKKLRLFDTFKGLPASSKKDLGVHREHQYSCSLSSIKEYLQGFSNITFHKGLFPSSTKEVPESKYSFVHIDVDLYEGTIACLKYFYPRMLKGGIIISHDYSILNGVNTAFNEFLADKEENVIELPETQCMIIKL